MRLLYVSADRPESQFAAKELSRAMATPTDNAEEHLKHVIRFMIGAPRIVWRYPRQTPSNQLRGYTDSNWAGCPVTRRSTTCTHLAIGRHPIYSGSSTQTIVALSSGEAEFYSAVKGASRTIGTSKMYVDLGETIEPRLWTDSTAAKGIASRRGAGKIRHIHTPALWLQQWVSRKRLALHKVDGKKNEADAGTKYLERGPLERCLEMMNLFVRTESAAEALKVQTTRV